MQDIEGAWMIKQFIIDVYSAEYFSNANTDYAQTMYFEARMFTI